MLAVGIWHESAVRVSIACYSHTAATSDWNAAVANAGTAGATSNWYAVAAAAAGVGPEARVALAEVHLPGGRVAAAGLELTAERTRPRRSRSTSLR